MTEKQPSQSAPKLLDRVRGKIRLKHYSIRTEQAYVDWIKRFILFHGKHHPEKMGAAEVEAFLTHLAVVGKVAASTQNHGITINNKNDLATFGCLHGVSGHDRRFQRRRFIVHRHLARDAINRLLWG